MTTLATARTELAAALAATGLRSTASVPDQIEPPILIVQGAEDYLSVSETTFDETDVQVTVDVFVLADYRSNAQAADKLDDMLAAVVPAILGSGWSLAGAGSPGPYMTADWVAFGLRLSCSRFVEIS